MRYRRGCRKRTRGDLARRLRGWPIVPLALVADRITKALAKSAGARELIPGVLRCRLVGNTGMAFSMLADHTWLPTALTVLLIVALAAHLTRRPDEDRLARAGYWLIMGGGLGNLWDRLASGYVIDFMELEFVRFAIFNVADVCICVGAGVTLLSALIPGEAVDEDGEI